MKRRIACLFLILLLPCLLHAAGYRLRPGTLTPQAYESRLKEGIEAFYQTEWDKASLIFTHLMQQNEDDPRAYFFYAMIPFWNYFYGGESSSAADDFFERSQKAISISHRRLRDNPHDTTMVLMLSGLYGYQSLVSASEHEYQTALSSGSRGFQYTRQLLSLDSSDPRALIGKGIFNYMIGGVPKELRWMTNMMGLRGNKKAGFVLLKEAARSNSYVSNDVGMILTYLYEREGEYKKALVEVRELLRRYPQNVIFQFNYARLLEKCGHRSEARQEYGKVVQAQGSYWEDIKRQSQNRIKKLK